jgi:hypothetical protein
MYDEMYEKGGRYARQVVRFPDGKSVATVQIAKMHHGDHWDLLISLTDNGEDDGIYSIPLHKPDEEDINSLAGEMIALFGYEEKGWLDKRGDSRMSVREFGAAIAELAELPDRFWDDVEEVYG